MNRHHYSLFIHNCRLVFLLRQEPDGQDLNIFKPAEWRWKIPQVCDGEWHHYAISIDFPQVIGIFLFSHLRTIGHVTKTFISFKKKTNFFANQMQQFNPKNISLEYWQSVTVSSINRV